MSGTAYTYVPGTTTTRGGAERTSDGRPMLTLIPIFAAASFIPPGMEIIPIIAAIPKIP